MCLPGAVLDSATLGSASLPSVEAMMAAGCEGSANFGTATTMPGTSPETQAAETKGDADAPTGVERS